MSNDFSDDPSFLPVYMMEDGELSADFPVKPGVPLGKFSEVVMFNRVLKDEEIDSIRKGRVKMKKIKHLLRMAAMGWCGWGVVRLCIFLNPVVFWGLYKVIPGFWTETGGEALIPDSSDAEQIFRAWFLIFMVCFGCALVSLLLHKFTKWFFAK